MTQEAATLARTVAAGHPPAATIQVACPGGGPFPVRYAVDGEGAPLLLTRAGSAVDTALTAPEDDDVAAVLAVPAPSGGRLWISGWSSRVTDAASLRSALLEFAAQHPTADLLDVGQGHTLHRLAVAEVRLEGADGRLTEIDPEEYAAA